MSDRKSHKRDNSKNPIGPASGHPGVEGEHSSKTSGGPGYPRNTQHGDIHSVPKGERSEHGGVGHHGGDNRHTDQERAGKGH